MLSRACLRSLARPARSFRPRRGLGMLDDARAGPLPRPAPQLLWAHPGGQHTGAPLLRPRDDDNEGSAASPPPRPAQLGLAARPRALGHGPASAVNGVPARLSCVGKICPATPRFSAGRWARRSPAGEWQPAEVRCDASDDLDMQPACGFPLPKLHRPRRRTRPRCRALNCLAPHWPGSPAPCARRARAVIRAGHVLCAVLISPGRRPRSGGRRAS